MIGAFARAILDIMQFSGEHGAEDLLIVTGALARTNLDKMQFSGGHGLEDLLTLMGALAATTPVIWPLAKHLLSYRDSDGAAARVDVRVEVL